MASAARVSAETLVSQHPGLSEKSDAVQCPLDQLRQILREGDCAALLDTTIEATGTHPIENNLLVYRQCGRNACQAEVGIVITDSGEVLDAQRFGAPCTGKL